MLQESAYTSALGAALGAAEGDGEEAAVEADVRVLVSVGDQALELRVRVFGGGDVAHLQLESP